MANNSASQFVEEKFNKPKEDLQKRALLNSITGGLDFGSNLLVGFFLNPIMVSILGSDYFGAWKVIGQMNSYMATADVRAATSLKYILSRNRTTSTDLELKKAVSCALFSNAIFIPLYSFVGLVIIWFSPIIAGVDEQYFLTVRTASAFLILSFITTQFFFLFESTLQGMNLSYKRIGVRAFITILGGLGMAGVLYSGYGIVGLAVIQVIISIMTGISFWWIVKRTIPWFGFVKVGIKEIVSFIKLSGWFMLLKFADLTNQSIDMILLGYLAGPTYVSIYAITKYSTTAATGLVRSISTAVSVGIGKFIGEGKMAKIVEARYQLLTLQWFLLILMGSLICLFNRSFVNLWTKKDLYGGQFETFLIVLIALFITLYQIDSSIVNSSLDLGKKIISSFLSSLLTIISAILLVPYFGISGLLFALLIGTFNNTIVYAKLVQRLTQTKGALKDLFFSRTSSIGICMLGISAYLGRYIDIHNWFVLIFYMLLTFLTLVPLIWFIAIGKNERFWISSRIKKSTLYKIRI